MPARLIKQKNNRITVEFTIELTGQMLTDEQALQQSLNEAGQIAMAPMIKQFDTSGEPIRVNGVKHTVKNYSPEIYETPYGRFEWSVIPTKPVKADELMCRWKTMHAWS